MTRKEAYERAAHIIGTSAIPGMTEGTDLMAQVARSTLGCEWRTSGGGAVRLSVGTTHVGDELKAVVHVGNASQTLRPAAARAAARLYAEVVDLACRIEAELEDVEIDRSGA